ncbi:DUF4189 domain-containing protein [Pseudorhodoplanes sp.]|uniref:DUF4189 domain-containing protein n=1 Tax=Pseudorhodoplanes sp. TaxID=1934341 RepID=UPI002B9C27AF|nr:DUF4189 domain-containing protein [Pseudorhodoplanes sp.]HWV51264.1 DUF4189 domain-containing protein [Pseudorhodoplanes sp.]
MRALRAAFCAATFLTTTILVHAPASAHGALAIGACGAYGFSRGYAATSQAEKEALSRCSGKNCKIVASVRGTCMAFSVELANPCGAYGYATGEGLARTQNRALRECSRNGGKDCVIRAFACD